MIGKEQYMAKARLDTPQDLIVFKVILENRDDIPRFIKELESQDVLWNSLVCECKVRSMRSHAEDAEHPRQAHIFVEMHPSRVDGFRSFVEKFQ
jgi:hypothetical protein